MLDFIIAVLPWLVLGICVVIIIAKVSKKKIIKKENGEKLPDARKKPVEKEESSDNMAMGMSLGMCFGAMFSTLGFIPLTYGISFGMLIGMTIGMLIDNK